MKHINIEDIWPLTPLQAGILFHDLLAPESEVYHEQLRCKLLGNLDVDAFQRAWQAVVQRNAALRACFVWKGKRKPLQVVLRDVTPPWKHVDWTDSPQGEHADRLALFCRDDLRQGIDIGKAPLMRFTLVRLAVNEHAFVWTSHHLILDGWSLGLVLKEVLTCYEAFRKAATPALPAARPYKEYLSWLGGRDAQSAETFWRQHLAGIESPNTIAGVGPKTPAEDFRTEIVPVGASLLASLSDMARRERVTLSTVLQAAWALVLARYSGARDVVFGSTCSGRPAELHGVEAMVGMFINTLPVRAQVTADIGVGAWLRQLQDAQLERQVFEHTALTDVHKWSGLPATTPLFESIFVFENYPLDKGLASGVDGLQISDVRGEERTHYPITVVADPGGCIRLVYDASRLTPATAQRLAAAWHCGLTCMAAAPHTRLGNIDVMGDVERTRIIKNFNTTDRGVPPHATIHNWFESQAAATPEFPALITRDAAYSYGELNAMANRVAHTLLAQGVQSNDLVGVHAERNAEMVASLLAILKVGAAYVPLDPKYPAERLDFMLAHSRAACVLSSPNLATRLNGKTRTLVLSVDPAVPETNPAVCVDTDDRAYVLYTSGSTGRPKGVEIEHRSVVALIAWAARFYSREERARVLASTSICFDLSVFEIFATLAVGHTVVLVETLFDLASWSHAGVTLLNSVPAVLAEYVAARSLPESVRAINVGGEPLPGRLLDTLLEHPHIERVCNAYGPTEDTTFSTCGVFTKDGPRDIHIGRPLDNSQVYILDADLRPQPVGVEGEIYIGGAGLARGYLENPQLTAERFIPNPFIAGARLYRTGDLAAYMPNGNVRFLGRRDGQVKIRGMRVELGEIESVLRRHPNVADVAVVLHTEGAARPCLAAYVISSGDANLQGVEAYARATLPEHMVPRAWATLAELPKTPSGKVDRRRLAERPVVTTPVTPSQEVMGKSELTVANIWSELVGRPVRSRQTNFFLEGGDSLLAIQAVALTQQAFGINLPLRAVFDHPTVEQFAAYVEQQPTQMRCLDFVAEATQVSAFLDEHPVLPGPRRPKQRILLTGATGFLGAFLLDALLQSTGLEVYCLVRAATPQGGLERLRAALKSYGLATNDVESRVRCVVGELGKPRLGLSDTAFLDLARTIDAIVHNGALVNMGHRYGTLKPANVFGCQEILKLAIADGAKPVHFVSTISVFEGQLSKELCCENDAIDLTHLAPNGYVQSKAVAEAMMLKARQLGVPVSIYRPSAIIGHSQTGASNRNDFVSLLLRACIRLKQAPRLEYALNLVPVDFVSNAIVSQLTRANGDPATYHVVSPVNTPISDIVEWVRSAGFEVDTIPYSAWLSALQRHVRAEGDNAMAALLGLFPEASNESLTTLRIDAQNLHAALSHSAQAAAQVGRPAMARQLRALCDAGFLPQAYWDQATWSVRTLYDTPQKQALPLAIVED